MKRVRCTDASGVSLEALLKRIERLEWLVAGGNPDIPSSGATNDSHLSEGGRQARAMRDAVQRINADNTRFWAKESA